MNWVHDLFPEIAERLGVRLGPLGAPLKWLRDRALNAASHNVVLGQRMAELTRALGVPSARTTVIHNWSDGERVYPDADGAKRLRARWGLGERFVVGYSGNMGRAHPFAGLLDAAERLRAIDSIRFVLIGGGAKARALRDETARRGLHNVQFHPLASRATLAQSLSVADVHVVTLEPSLEGLIVPSKFYGVAAAERACLFLGAADGEIASILAAHQAGIRVDPFDGEAIAAVIQRMAGDRPDTHAMGRRARRALRAHFDRRLAMQAWDAVLASAGS